MDPYCQIMVAASTVTLLEGEFQFQRVGSLQLKGKSEAVVAYVPMAAGEAQAQTSADAPIIARSA